MVAAITVVATMEAIMADIAGVIVGVIGEAMGIMDSPIEVAGMVTIEPVTGMDAIGMGTGTVDGTIGDGATVVGMALGLTTGILSTLIPLTATIQTVFMDIQAGIIPILAITQASLTTIIIFTIRSIQVAIRELRNRITISFHLMHPRVANRPIQSMHREQDRMLETV